MKIEKRKKKNQQKKGKKKQQHGYFKRQTKEIAHAMDMGTPWQPKSRNCISLDRSTKEQHKNQLL